MKTTIACPPTDELRQLIDGTLSGERQSECTDHLEACPCCQAKLEEQATGGTNLSRLVEGCRESEPASDSAYWPMVQSLEADPSRQVTVVPRSAPRRTDVPLDFLQPPTDSVYLGRLAHFDVMRVIGRGGMGVVLEAFDSKLQRSVAVKVLDPELAGDETARQRFCREARAAASVSHENVVAVHQVERAGDNQLPYLVMQLVTGESLEQRLERVRILPIREIVRIGMQAAHGLAAAHAQNLIHRDIKPGNILLEPPDDRVKITDFGLARAAEDVKLTRTGYVTGTPLYMAPEQAMGEEPDHRSDLFSLGAILYEMCAGQPPFNGTSALAILKRITDTPHRPLREINPAIPDWLAYTIDRLLAKKPADRIATAAQLAELLDFQWALMKTTSDNVPMVCEIEERKRVVRSRWIAGAVGATFLGLGLLAGRYLGPAGGVAARGGAAPLSAAGLAPSLPGSGSDGANEPASALKSSAEPIAVLSANAGAVWSVGFNPAGDTLAMAAEDGTVRVWDIRTKSIKSTFPAHRGVIWVAQYSHDGSVLATAGDEGFIKLWNPSKSEPVQQFKHPNAVRGLALARDGRTLYAGDREGGVKVWSLDSTEPVAQTNLPAAVYSVALSPDEQVLANAGSDKVVRLCNAKTLTQKLPLEGHSGPVYSVAFNHDGTRLASVGWDRQVRLWDTGTGDLVQKWEAHAGDVWTIAWSPDGSQVVTGGHDASLKLWNAADGTLLGTFLGHKIAVHAVAFSRDGSEIASGGRDGSARLWKWTR